MGTTIAFFPAAPIILADWGGFSQSGTFQLKPLHLHHSLLPVLLPPSPIFRVDSGRVGQAGTWGQRSDPLASGPESAGLAAASLKLWKLHLLSAIWSRWPQVQTLSHIQFTVTMERRRSRLDRHWCVEEPSLVWD